MATAARG
ncbi:tRNA pseudouridine synthase A, partial [Yersinia pestis PY-94]